MVNNNGDRKSPSNNNGDRKIPIWGVSKYRGGPPKWMVYNGDTQEI